MIALAPSILILSPLLAQTLERNSEFVFLIDTVQHTVCRLYLRDGFCSVSVNDSSEDYYQKYIEIIDKLRLGVENLFKNGWPATFIYVYNESWQVVRLWTPTLENINGGSEFIGDLYSWRVDPYEKQVLYALL